MEQCQNATADKTECYQNLEEKLDEAYQMSIPRSVLIDPINALDEFKKSSKKEVVGNNYH